MRPIGAGKGHSPTAAAIPHPGVYDQRMTRDIILRIIASIVIVFLIFALHRAITVGPRPNRPVFAAGRPLLFAHRGGSALAPENTLAAFRNGAELGADALQLDVRLTADGQLVVIHDDTVDRTTSGTSRVIDQTVTDLKQLDAGYHFTADNGATFPFRGQGVTIPTLAEVFAAFPDQIVNIDIKDPLPQAAQRLADDIAQAGAGDRVIVGSFHNDILAGFRDLAPDVATVAGPGETRISYLLQRLGLRFLHRALGDTYQVPLISGRFRLDTPTFIANAHKLNQRVDYGTIDDPVEMRRLLEQGADGIITDRPDLAAKVFRSLGYK